MTMPEIVSTAAGRLAGARAGGVRSFLGIPYACTTAGEGRFAPPRHRRPWTGVRDARTFGPACPQPPIRENLVIAPEVEAAMFALADEPQDEDCLSLNVWTPAASPNSGLPVMVSLHGGGFKSGSGSACSAPWFDGTRLAQGGEVVVVTINHRIGVLGHLLVDNWEGSGNVGLLDLVAALEWIRENIAAFGGDPDRVTIFGESGGGGKVMALLTTDAAAGLFARAICQSGTMSWMTSGEAAAATEALARELGGAGARQLRALPVRALVDAALAVTRAGMRFGPVVDGSVLTAPVSEALAAGAGADVPLIIGVTRDEASAFLGPPVDPAAPDWHNLVARHTDEMFRTPAVRAASAKAVRGPAATYMYEFAWETPVLGGSLGAAHGVDVSFPFDNTELHPATAGSASARGLGPVIRDAWASFARRGDPNHPRLVQWPPFQPGDGATLIIDDEPRVESRPPAGDRAVAIPTAP
jgi:para-nitrobenzyl esterase